MNKTLVILGIIITFTLPVLSLIFSEQVVIGEKLCVDGRGNMNLEGLMCEETGFFTSGMNEEEALWAVISIGLLGLIIFFIGISYDAKVSGVEE